VYGWLTLLKPTAFVSNVLDAMQSWPPFGKRPPTESGELGRGALLFAQAEIARGAREIPPGTNGGPFVWEYTGSRTDGPWCAAFVQWCFEMSSESLPWRRTHSAKGLYKRIGRAGSFVDVPLPGDVVCWDRGIIGSPAGHTGIVARVIGDTFWSIEGNRGRAGIVAEFRHEIGEARLLGFARS